MQWLKLAVISCQVVIVMAGCTKEKQQEPPKAVPVKSATNQAFVDIVTSQKLPLSKDKTVGAVFNEYKFFADREWKESRNADGKAYVDFRGLFPAARSGQNGVKRQGVEVKFVVSNKGDMYIAMVSRIDVMTDGTMRLYPLGDSSKIVESIYANKEISY